ncbi:MAG: hypothetical protein KAG14_00650 [Mycoplasmataceae bacterium]|nr:hypothetical protein [Mycoplasmataceae bacterium]
MNTIKENKSDMIITLRQRPKLFSWILLSFQHVLAMFGSTVLTPIIINSLAKQEIIGTDMALFSSGVGTLIYIAVTRARVPIYLGSSFAYIAAIGALYPIYGTSTFFGLLGVAVVYITVSILIYFFGTKWLKKILPPVVVGPMIMIIGLGLAAIAVKSIGIADINHIDWWSVGIATITAGTAMLSSLLFRGRLKLMPIMLSLVVGFIVASIVSSFHNHYYDIESNKDMKLINWNKNDWSGLSTYIGTPKFNHTPFHNMASSKWSFMPFLLMMPIAFATIAEHIGDHTVLGKITGQDYVNKDPGVGKTLLGDGLATGFAGLIGAPANTSYGENTTTVGLSKVSSVYVTGLAAIFAIIISFVQIIPSVLGLIPKPVLGGLEIILFGFIAANGLKVLIGEKVDMSKSRNIFVLSTMLILGLGGAVLGISINNLTISFTGTSLAMFTGIILNLILPNDRGIDLNKMQKLSR